MGDRTVRHEAHGLRTSLAELLARADQVLTERFGVQKRSQGVSNTHWQVLAALLERDGLSLTELAGRMLLRQPTLSKAIDRMEQARLVKRLTPREDLRRTIIRLTKHGRSMAEPLLAQARQQDAALARALGKAQSRELKAALQELINLVQNQPHHNWSR